MTSRDRERTLQPRHLGGLAGGRECELVVETNRVLIAGARPERQVLEELLISRGYRVISASGALQALSLTEAQRFDAVLLDLSMPILNGLEALQQMRKLPGYQDSAIILFSPSGEQRLLCLRAGASHFLGPLKKFTNT